MVKKIIALMAVLIICSGIFSGCDNSWQRIESSACHETLESSDVYFDNHDKSWAAYFDARTHFTTPWGEYTDDFGGVFIDNNGIVNIYMIGDRIPLESEYLIYKQANYSYNFLKSIYDELGKIMPDYSLWQVAICDSCNVVIVSLEDESEIPLIILHLSIKNLYRKDSLYFYIGENNIVLL